MDKILIITGGSKGLGLSLAKEYHKNGYRIISISRSTIENNTDFEHYQCDLSDTQKLQKVILELFSTINKAQLKNITLINNAGGLGTINTVENLNPSEIDRTISLNLTAPLILSSQFIKHTKNWECKKKIINISSGAAINPYESWSVYCASKSGLDMMTKVISKEQDNLKNGVHIVSIYPGVVATNMQAEIRSTPKENFKSLQRFVDLHTEGNLSLPEDVAAKIYKLDTTNVLKNGEILDVRNV